MKFISAVEKFENNVYSTHLKVPKDIVESLSSDGKKRVLCTIDAHDYFHAGLMPSGDGSYFIILSKARLKALGLVLGQTIEVQLTKDNSKYGMSMPDEFNEVLLADIEGASWFENLTDGKKRNLIHMVATVKSSDLRITKALIILDHLRANTGKLDFKLLIEAMKPQNRQY